jgi:hypothetical protein
MRKGLAGGFVARGTGKAGCVRKRKAHCARSWIEARERIRQLESRRRSLVVSGEELSRRKIAELLRFKILALCKREMGRISLPK